jgi:selenocysteine lyase/cysteine desulfurase
MDSGLLADLLDREYGICTRAGLHCSAAAHKTLGTTKAGLVRVSFGYFNTRDDLQMLLNALEHISSSKALDR